MYKLEDKKIIFDCSEDYKKLKFIDSGSSGNVYKIKINKEYYALKIFKRPLRENAYDYDEKIKINIPSFFPPIMLSYLNDKFNGYLMNFCNGSNMSNERLHISVDDFIKYSNILVDDADKLSELGYRIFDINISNVIFDSGFKVVDLDSYIYLPNSLYFSKDLKNVKNYNRREIKELIIDILLLNTNSWHLSRDDFYYKKIVQNYILDNISLEETLNLLCEKFKIKNDNKKQLSLKKLEREFKKYSDNDNL